MSRISDMLNGKKKFITTKTAVSSGEELDAALGRLRNMINSGLADLANDLADEIEKNSEKAESDDGDAYDGDDCEDFEKCAKKAGWTKETIKSDAVDHPSHYCGKKYEVIDLIDDFGLNFNKGNALKYLLRAGHKDDYVQDLKKAIWYLNREIETYNTRKGL